MSCLPQPSQLAFAVAAHVASYIHRLDVYPNCQISLQEIAPEPTTYSSLDGVSWSIYPDTNPAFTNLTTTLAGTILFNDVVWGAPSFGWEIPQYNFGKWWKFVFFFFFHNFDPFILYPTENGHVYLRGLYSSNASVIQNNTLLGILPGNLRPSYTLNFPAIAHGNDQW